MLGGMNPSPAFLDELDESLEAHELVNVRMNAAGKKSEVKEIAANVASELDCSVVQVIGHTSLFFRPSAAQKINPSNLAQT